MAVQMVAQLVYHLGALLVVGMVAVMVDPWD